MNTNATTSTGGGFDPRPFLRKLGKGDYLEVKFRLLWLRTEHPDADVTTELVQMDRQERFAMFKAIVTLPGGGSSTGYGSETATDFPDYPEKAETKALGRALAALGYGTQFCEDHDLANPDGTPHVVDSPVERTNGGIPRPQQSTNGNGSLATPAQLKLIYLTAERDLHITDDEMEDNCQRRYGRLPLHLTKSEASELIDAMKKATTTSNGKAK